MYIPNPYRTNNVPPPPTVVWVKGTAEQLARLTNGNKNGTHHQLTISDKPNANGFVQVSRQGSITLEELQQALDISSVVECDSNGHILSRSMVMESPAQILGRGKHFVARRDHNDAVAKSAVNRADVNGAAPHRFVPPSHHQPPRTTHQGMVLPHQHHLPPQHGAANNNSSAHPPPNRTHSPVMLSGSGPMPAPAAVHSFSHKHHQQQQQPYTPLSMLRGGGGGEAIGEKRGREEAAAAAAMVPPPMTTITAPPRRKGVTFQSKVLVKEYHIGHTIDGHSQSFTLGGSTESAHNHNSHNTNAMTPPTSTRHVFGPYHPQHMGMGRGVAPLGIHANQNATANGMLRNAASSSSSSICGPTPPPSSSSASALLSTSSSSSFGGNNSSAPSTKALVDSVAVPSNWQWTDVSNIIGQHHNEVCRIHHLVNPKRSAAVRSLQEEIDAFLAPYAVEVQQGGLPITPTPLLAMVAGEK